MRPLVEMSKIVIEIENLTKEYRLGIINHGTLHQDLKSWWARVRGKEDPNSLISTGETKKESNDNSHLLALDNVSFKVREGEVLGIIGRNGAGKSTLLKILSRITAPTRGAVKLKGRVASLLEVGTGFHPELTGRENVYLNGAILGMTKKEISLKFEEIVAFAEIEKFIDTPVKRYSSGMYVRLAFAVAAHLEPEILIVDEVLAVGDAQFQKKCLGKMSDVAKGGRTVLFVSHNMQAIRQLCHRAILLNHGSIVEKGTPDIVIERYLTRNKDSVDVKQAIIQLPEDPVIKMIDVVFSQAGKQPDFWVTGQPIEVIIKFKIKKSTANLRVFFDLLDNQENLIFRSFHDGDYSDVEMLPPGEYYSRAVIPGDFLAPQKHLLRIGATIFGSHSCTGNHLVFPFQLHSMGRVNRAYTYEVNLGSIAPLIEWETRQTTEFPAEKIN